jgi:acyl carrier protein
MSEDFEQVRSTVARIWSEVLGCGSIGDEKTLNDLGASSLKVIKIFLRLEKAYPFLEAESMIVDNQTVASLSRLIVDLARS